MTYVCCIDCISIFWSNFQFGYWLYFSGFWDFSEVYVYVVECTYNLLVALHNRMLWNLGRNSFYTIQLKSIKINVNISFGRRNFISVLIFTLICFCNWIIWIGFQLISENINHYYHIFFLYYIRDYFITLLFKMLFIFFLAYLF